MLSFYYEHMVILGSGFTIAGVEMSGVMPPSHKSLKITIPESAFPAISHNKKNCLKYKPC
jgi:hypothetical protein